MVVTDVTQGDSSLILTNMTINDSGNYRCRASNDHSAAYSDTVQVSVKGKQTSSIISDTTFLNKYQQTKTNHKGHNYNPKAFSYTIATRHTDLINLE